MAATDVFGGIRAAHVDQVVSSRERPAGAGEHQCPQVVKEERVEGGMNLTEHPERERVQLLGAIQHDRGDRPVAAAENLLVGHDRLIPPAGAMRPRPPWRFVTGPVTFRYRCFRTPGVHRPSACIRQWHDICCAPVLVEG